MQQAPRPPGQGRRRGGALGAVQPPAGHPQVDQPAVLRPPPLPRFGEGEVDRALAHVVALGRATPGRVGRGDGRQAPLLAGAPRPGGGRRCRGQQEAPPFRLGELRRLGMHHGIVGHQAEPEALLQLAHHPLRVAQHARLERQVADADVPAPGRPVRGEEDERVPRDRAPELLAPGPGSRPRRPSGGWTGGSPGPSAGQGGVAGQTSVGLQDVRGRGAGQEVQVDGGASASQSSTGPRRCARRPAGPRRWYRRRGRTPGWPGADEQWDRHVRTRAVPVVAVPEHPGGAQPLQQGPAPARPSP